MCGWVCDAVIRMEPSIEILGSHVVVALFQFQLGRAGPAASPIHPPGRLLHSHHTPPTHPSHAMHASVDLPHGGAARAGDGHGGAHEGGRHGEGSEEGEHTHGGGFEKSCSSSGAWAGERGARAAPGRVVWLRS